MADLSSSLFATKETATAASDAKQRGDEALESEAATLNFKVDLAFKTNFKRVAVDHNIKLNELLRQALDAWKREKGLNID
jgi:hypothetical protein